MIGEGRRADFGLISSLLDALMLLLLPSKGLASERRFRVEGKNIVRGSFRALTRLTINTVPEIIMTRPNNDRPRMTKTIVPETVRSAMSILSY